METKLSLLIGGKTQSHLEFDIVYVHTSQEKVCRDTTYPGIYPISDTAKEGVIALPDIYSVAPLFTK